MSESVYRVFDNGAGTMIAVGGLGLILRSINGGADWVAQESGVENHLYGVSWGYVVDTPGWVVVGEFGIVLISADDGLTWETRSSGVLTDLYAVAFAGAMIAVGQEGVMRYSVDLGRNWDFRDSGTQEDLVDISTGDGMFTIVGANDTIIIGYLAVLADEVYVFEQVFTAEQAPSTGVLQEEHSVAMEFAGSTGDVHYEYMGEQLTTADFDSSSTVQMGQTVLEAADIAAVSQAIGVLLNNCADFPSFSDTIQAFYGVIVAEGINAADVIAFLQTYHGLAESGITATETTAASAVLNRTIIQNMTVRDLLATAWIALLLEQVSITDPHEVLVTKIQSILEKVAVQEGFTAAGEFLASITQALACMEVTEAAKGAEATDSTTLAVDILDRANYYETLLLPVLMTATPTMTGSMRLPVIESLNLIDAPTTQAILNSLVSEGIAFRLTFNTGDATYTGWVMNATTFSVSEYDNYPFNSFAQIQGQYYGTNDNGMYLLEGENDAGIPIQARVRLGETNFGKSVLKRLDSVYLGFRADGSLVLKTVTEGNIERWYKVTGDTEKIHRQRVHPLAKGHKAVWWEFSLENVDGADFEVSEIEFVPVMLSRSV